MGTGFIGTKQDLVAMAKKEGYPRPESIQTFGELINWISTRVISGQKGEQKENKKRKPNARS
jgi:hypothetical protein